MQPESHLVLPLPFPPPLSLPTMTGELSSPFVVSSPSSVSRQEFDPNPRKKKRSKTMAVKVDDPEKPRPKKPDPNAPKITRPCTECGKRFWSWKALFGHMRCHPERQWRGINPPPNLRSLSPRKALAGLKETESSYQVWAVMTEEDHEVAECLLKLADGPVVAVDRGGGGGGIVVIGRTMGSYEDACVGATTWQQFECTSCKKVFGSHQALGGHRASHKNVKGCFAMTRSSGECSEDPFLGTTEVSSEGAATTMTITGIDGGHHRCGICNRVFPSGQALGGHKRCHWEKGEEEEEEEGGQFLCLDLNQPAAPLTADEDSSSSSHLSDLTLDLRLGL